MSKIILLSEDSKLIESFKQYYKGNSFFNVIVINTIKNIDVEKYDAIVIDYFMSKSDFYNVINEIKNINIYIFVILPNLRINIYPFLNRVNINYIFYKPISMPFVDQIINLSFNNDISVIDSYRYEIISVFMELVLSFKLLGTRYLYFLILLILCDGKDVNHQMISIISNKYHTNESCVKKAMSYAIDSCFDIGDNEDIKRKIFGSCWKEGGSMSNLDFIYNLSLYIMYKLNKKEFIRK